MLCEEQEPGEEQVLVEQGLEQDEEQVLVEQGLGLNEELGQEQVLVEQGLGLDEELGQEQELVEAGLEQVLQTVHAIHTAIRLGQNRINVPFIYTDTNLSGSRQCLDVCIDIVMF